MGTDNQDSLNPVKILLAEDDQGQANLTVQVFKKAKTPFEITRVHDGEEAMEYLKKEGPYQSAQTPDLILLDINMPKMDGYEVLENVKSDPVLKKIPVLIFTCSDSNQDMEKAYQKRADFYFVKPGELGEFFEFVRRVENIWHSDLNHVDP